jgi:ATP-dependent Clp protease ATP-binding subunit ClpA
MLMQAVQLDLARRSEEAMQLETGLRRKIVGQDEAVQAVVDLYQVFRAGLNPPGRPVGNLLFLGPTGAGKTRVVEATAEELLGDPRAVIKVDCAEFQHSHEIAKLIGSPPGYLGHRDTHPLITQQALLQYHTSKLKISFLLFDEIEKASDALWQLLLGILDKATLTLGDNRRVDLSQTMIFTLKYGARHLKRAIERHVVHPLANLLATDQVALGDVITIDRDRSKRGFEFFRQAEGALAGLVRPNSHTAARPQSLVAPCAEDSRSWANL